MKKLIQYIDSNAIIFAAEVIIFLMLQVYKYTWINYIDFIADILRVALVVWMIITVITGVLAFGKLILSADMVGKKLITFVILLSFSISLYLGYVSEIEFGYTFGGSIPIIEKIKNDQEYNLIIRMPNRGDIKLECDMNVYNKVIVDENVAYTMEYRWLVNSDYGVLQSIDVDDYLDNR